MGVCPFYKAAACGQVDARWCYYAANMHRDEKKLESGLGEVKEVREGKTRNIRIGFLEAMDTALFVEPTASYFSHRFPGIDISLEKHSFAGLPNGLVSGELDIIITLDFEARVIQDIAYNTYYPVQAVFLMSRNHPLASKKDLKPIDFAEETSFTTEAIASTDQIEEFRGICRKNGFECRNILTAKNQGSVMLQVRSGKGVALVDTSLVNIYDKNLYSYFILPKETAPVSVIYAWKKDNLNPAVALYINTLIDSGPIDIYNT